MQPSVPLPSEGTAGHAALSEQVSSSDESAHHGAKISSLNAEVEQLKADKQTLLARLTSAEEEDESENKLAKLDTEVAQLKTDRQLLISRVGTTEQLLAEARQDIEQKEGHLQGLQVGAVTWTPLWLLFKLVCSPSHTTSNVRCEHGSHSCGANKLCRLPVASIWTT